MGEFEKFENSENIEKPSFTLETRNDGDLIVITGGTKKQLADLGLKISNLIYHDPLVEAQRDSYIASLLASEQLRPAGAFGVRLSTVN